MYPVEGSCDQFYHCTEGIASLIKCPTGVIFEPALGACVHADQTKREDCSASRKWLKEIKASTLNDF